MKKGLIIKDAAQVVTVSGFESKKGARMRDIGVIPGGSVVIEGETILSVGDFDTISRGLVLEDYHIIDARGKTVTPGFVDSHTHVIFGGYRADEYNWRLRGDSYVQIMNRGGGIVKSVTQTREAAYEDLVAAGLKRLDSMMRFGVTTVEGKSGYGLDLETEVKQLRATKALNDRHVLDVVPTFLGPHAIPRDFEGGEMAFIQYMTREVLPAVKEDNLAEFADIFTEKGIFELESSRIYLEAAKALGFKIKMHADEIYPLGGAELAAEFGAVSADHLLQVSDEGIRRMKEKGVVATLLPLTAFSLKADYARARDMIDAGLAVALATDFNPGSCFSESIPLLIALSTLYMGMTPEETLTALTLNGAAALDRSHVIGSIDPGKQGDILIHEFDSYEFIPYHFGVSTVETVIKKGRVVYSKA
ncbi:MAG: imidazolonepropionase [delta proteobacterium ML8_F1]|nr:MAG: imidazolonepropionase [delta proteobacterium ML8_F1]